MEFSFFVHCGRVTFSFTFLTECIAPLEAGFCVALLPALHLVCMVVGQWALLIFRCRVYTTMAFMMAFTSNLKVPNSFVGGAFGSCCTHCLIHTMCSLSTSSIIGDLSFSF